jgi:predicted ATPase
VSEVPGVPRAIIAAMGLNTRGQDDPVEQLCTYFAQRDLLLVLDNFEQVVSAATVVARLMASSPRLQILVTSRELLLISGEHEYPVPPLSMPRALMGLSPDELLQYEAIALFRDRAHAVRHDFQLDHENAYAVVQICHRLDGLPLAIELAAARVRLFPPQALLARLEARLKALGGGMRDLPERQQTLRGAIDWSYDLLDANEQQLFWRLAVFSGGWGVEAAEEVCGPGLPLDVLEGLESLLNKSLLRRTGDSAGNPRFTMLETIGEYARERLAASDEEEAQRRRPAGR